MSKQFNIRLPERTKQQIKELVEAGGYRSQAELVMMLVDREYQRKMNDGNNQEQNRQNTQGT